MGNRTFLIPDFKSPSVRKIILSSANIIPKCRHKVYIWDNYVLVCDNRAYSLLSDTRFGANGHNLKPEILQFAISIKKLTALI